MKDFYARCSSEGINKKQCSEPMRTNPAELLIRKKDEIEKYASKEVRGYLFNMTTLRHFTIQNNNIKFIFQLVKSESMIM